MNSAQNKTLNAWIKTFAVGIRGLVEKSLADALDHRTVKEVISQAGHGFSVGDWLYLAAGGWTLADRDAAASLAEGMVCKVIDADSFELATSGIVSGLSGLTANTIYYLSSTPGAMQTAAPADDFVQHLGVSLSTTKFRIQIQRTNMPAASVDRLDVTGNLSVDATKIGAYGATAVTQPSAYTLTYATTNKVHANLNASDLSLTSTSTTPWGFNTQAEADSIQTQVNNLIDDMENVKQVLNSVIDDLKNIGFLQ